MPNIARMILMNSAQTGQEVDWKLAYFEVVAITNEVQAAIPKPEEQAPQGLHRFLMCVYMNVYISSADSIEIFL